MMGPHATSSAVNWLRPRVTGKHGTVAVRAPPAANASCSDGVPRGEPPAPMPGSTAGGLPRTCNEPRAASRLLEPDHSARGGSSGIAPTTSCRERDCNDYGYHAPRRWIALGHRGGPLRRIGVASHVASPDCADSRRRLKPCARRRGARERRTWSTPVVSRHGGLAVGVLRPTAHRPTPLEVVLIHPCNSWCRSAYDGPRVPDLVSSRSCRALLGDPAPRAASRPWTVTAAGSYDGAGFDMLSRRRGATARSARALRSVCGIRWRGLQARRG